MALNAKKTTTILAAALAGVLAVAAVFAGTDVGQTAEDFTLQPVQGGQPVSLLKNDGKPTLLFFWATWCPPCKREIPDLKKIHEEYAKKGLRMLGVALNFRESREDVVRFQQEQQLPYTVLWDVDNKIATEYGVEGIPTVILLDGKGVIRYRGHQMSEEFTKLLESYTASQKG